MEDNRVFVVTDSACDLPESYIAAHDNLRILPLRLMVDGKSLRSGLDISMNEVLDSMESGVIPKTSLPAPEDLESILTEIEESGCKKVLFVLISAGLSGTYNMVRMMLSSRETNLECALFDTKILSMSLGYMVMNALEMIEAGVPFEQLTDRLEAGRKDVDGLFYVATLKYLSAGGRIGGAAKYLGNLMNIKPIIGCDAEGKYYPRAICIGAKRTMAMARDIAARFAGKNAVEISVLHAAAREDAEKLADMIKAALPEAKISILELSPVLAVHVGRGMLAVCTRRAHA